MKTAGVICDHDGCRRSHLAYGALWYAVVPELIEIGWSIDDDNHVHLCPDHAPETP